MMKTKFLCLFLFLIVLGEFRPKANEAGNADYIDPSIRKTFTLSDAISSPAKAITDSLDPQADFNKLFDPSGVGALGIKLNPKAISFVKNYIKRNREDLMALKDKGLPYFRIIDVILKKHGLPLELKYLAVIESELKSRAHSSVGAVGPWQFMATTARNYGLKVTKAKDERTDYYKSTNAAAKYLKYLYGEFGDWLLVIAAYNGGPGVVYNAIKKSGSRNFWKLQYFLPAESRDHVKKYIGAHYVFEGQGGITTLTKAEASEQVEAIAKYLVASNLTNEELSKARSVTISGKYQSQVIAKNILMDMPEFSRYNPLFDKVMASEDTYQLKLPPEKMEMFIANKYQILNESVDILLKSAATALKTNSEAPVAISK